MNAPANRIRCAHCGSVDAACTSRTWSCPTEHGGCGDHGPDCAGLPLSICRVGRGNNPPHVAMQFSAPKPGRDLYREVIVFQGRSVDVVLDGSRVFLLKGGAVGEDVTARLSAEPGGEDAVQLLRDAHATLVRVGAFPWTPVAERSRARRGRAA